MDTTYILTKGRGPGLGKMDSVLRNDEVVVSSLGQQESSPKWMSMDVGGSGMTDWLDGGEEPNEIQGKPRK